MPEKVIGYVKCFNEMFLLKMKIIRIAIRLAI